MSQQLSPAIKVSAQGDLTPELLGSTKEPLRKELTQCQYCYRSRLSGGASLSKCSGCKMALYCSKECQKAAWPLHKEKCKLNRRVQSLPPVQTQAIKRLQAFTTKHRPTLSEFGKRALDLEANPSNSQKYILVLVVEPRPDFKRVETSFIVQSISVEGFDFFGPQADEVRGQVKHMLEENERVGGEGGYMAALVDVKTNVNNIVGVGFTAERFITPNPTANWKEVVMERMNKGIVI